MQGLMAAVIFGYHAPKTLMQSLGAAVMSLLFFFAVLIFCPGYGGLLFVL